MSDRILMIEDDESLSAMLKEYLGPLGIDLWVKPNAQAGLAALADGNYDALILDLMLPDADGFDVCRRVRSESDIPILMLTARGDETDRIVGLELGADDYLPKPFNPRELLARLRAILRRRAPSGRRLTPMRPLYVQIYIALVAILILFGVLVFAAWLLLPPGEERQRLMTGGAAVISDLLPAKDRPIAETRAALDRLYEQLGVDVSLYAADAKLLAAAGEVIPAPDLSDRGSGWIHGKGKGPKIALHLADGRWLIIRAQRDRDASWLAMLVLLAIAVAIGAYPIVRRITRRLERFQKSVDRLGAGELSARVAVQGNDEVAQLARSFNRAAERIERLVEAQRGMLAGASHELRTPLTRIRMGLELLAGDDQSELRARISRDIRELDELIEELLLASRLSAGESPESSEAVELLALSAEEGARVGAHVSGTPTTVQGDTRTLRRMLRNLFENARRHGRGAPVDATVEITDAGLTRIVVSDSGPGVPEAERERIFTPFYSAGGISEGGSGLGLALVREIARRHGGDARYLPREGGGSRFEVTLSGN